MDPEGISPDVVAIVLLGVMARVKRRLIEEGLGPSSGKTWEDVEFRAREIIVEELDREIGRRPND